jgi:adenine phosphoribosyltransferase
MLPTGSPSDRSDRLKALIRSVPDFPKPGVGFFDITTLLRDADGFRIAIEGMAEPFRDQGIELVVGIESRGFILGGAVARVLGAGFCPVRKPGKLPWKTIREAFDLEYGSDVIEIHEDAIAPGQRVLIVDDVLATGGTARAAARLVRRLDAHVHALAFLIELTFLNGRDKVAGEEVFSLLTY